MSRFLVVDDDYPSCQRMAELLREAGHEAKMASNGQEALDCLKDARFDAIVLDLMMPMVDGFTFLVRRRKLPLGADVPVLVVSGVHQPIELVGVLGVKASISKPYSPGELQTAIEQVLAEPAS